MSNVPQSTLFYQDYYYVREGDFLPERFGDSRYRNDRMMLKLFIENGCIFPTREEAAVVSKAIRAFLLVFRAPVQSTQQHRSVAAEQKGEGPQELCNQHQCHSSNTQIHNRQISACRQGEGIQGVNPRIVVINLS